MPFDIVPAIDLRAGHIVRASDGSLYDTDPIGCAAAFVDQGARWLHVVDLDRAFATGRDNGPTIRAIASLPGAQVQLGGFLGTADLVREGFHLGAARVVLSTEAVAKPGTLESLVWEFGAGRLAAAIETRAGRVIIRPGNTVLEVPPAELAERIRRAGIATIVYRDLVREGTLEGADVAGAAAVAGGGAWVIVSGGIGGPEHVTAARAAGLAGAILGRALYEGRLTVQEALACSV